MSMLCVSYVAEAQEYSNSYTILVENTEGEPVPGLPVYIADLDLQTTNAQGTFVIDTDFPLRMPILAELEDVRYELVQLAFFEEEASIRLTVERILLENEFTRVIVKDAAQHDVPDMVFSFNGKPFRTDERGKISFTEPLTYPAVIQLNSTAFEIYEKIFVKEEHALLIGIEAIPEEFLTEDTLMQSYEADFDRIAQQLQSERKVFEAKNEEIRNEILKIRDNLVREEDLSDDQKVELRNYLARMETAVEANNEALRMSEARTREAISKLKQLVSEKDSINLIAQGKILQMEQNQAKVEAQYRQKVLIFAGISIALLILTLGIYIVAVKFQKQKQFLKFINEKLKITQRDLTRSIKELNRKRSEIEDHNQQLEVFVYKASHDIKGPLRSIMGLTQIGMHDVKDSAAQEYFEHIHKSTKRLDNLLMDLLKLTRTKQAVIEKQPVAIQHLVDEAIQSFANSPNFNRIQFDVSIEEGLEFNSDEKMLYSIIQNFVENGIKYADPDKNQLFLKINIGYNEAEQCIEFAFHDNGLGIDKQHLPKIFDMFYKIDPQSDGTGLGLHIVKLSIEKLGGTIHVRSARGKGSCFTLRFYEKAAIPA